jgi:hypothetical protein
MGKSDYLTTDDIHGYETVDVEIELPNGTTGTIEVEQVGLDVTDKLERWEDNGKTEDEIVQYVFDEHVVRPPDLDVTEMSADRADLIMRGVFEGWGLSEDDIKELIEDHQGN